MTARGQVTFRKSVMRGGASLLGILRLRANFALGREALTPLRMTVHLEIRKNPWQTELLHKSAGIFSGGAAYCQAVDL